MFFNKVLGYDRILVFVIKDCLLYILLILIVLINFFFSNFVFFKVWKKLEVVLYFKDGDYEIFSNNCFILLLFVFFKVIEKIVLN